MYHPVGEGRVDGCGEPDVRADMGTQIWDCDPLGRSGDSAEQRKPLSAKCGGLRAITSIERMWDNNQSNEGVQRYLAAFRVIQSHSLVD